jgi:uncharacterized protein YutE (UPF0331/DUF86 family)
MDDVILNKCAVIERCVRRAREEFGTDRAAFLASLTRQDAAILNIQRACEAAIDLGQHLVRRHCLGVPQTSREVFSLLAHNGWIEQGLADELKRMVGFRNIAVHDYQALSLPITVAILEHHLETFLTFSAVMLRHG